MSRWVFVVAVLLSVVASAQEVHQHPAPEKLGTVLFPVSCSGGVQQEFNRAVALLHSFTYKEAAAGFEEVSRRDPKCAIAYWGIAMTHYHQLWDLPPSAADMAEGARALQKAGALQASARERGFIEALGPIFNDAAVPYATRAQRYEAAMRELAAANAKDVEAQVFYSLALVSNASPGDREHRRQKEAVEILEPLFHEYPDHPGIPHYLIHACDNQELAQRGLDAARVYAGIAPSAPHALHMPSHIFTRLGLWDDSVASNLAARSAARRQGDTGEELHAMDYLVYAYLQQGRDGDAARMIEELKAMPGLSMGDFKIGYAATAMPVRYIVERQRWSEAREVADPAASAQPHVVAIAAWARGLGAARTGEADRADRESAKLMALHEKLSAMGNSYWSGQVRIMQREVEAWSAQAKHRDNDAVAILRGAADDEDAVEKLPVTPGPIVPAREQLGELLLEQGDKAGAAEAFAVALKNAPGRRGAVRGAAKAAR